MNVRSVLKLKSLKLKNNSSEFMNFKYRDWNDSNSYEGIYLVNVQVSPTVVSNWTIANWSDA
jgi:hypothetical protein